MKRVQRHLLDEWIDREYPDAITKLARRSRIPASSLSKIRAGRVPKGIAQRDRLAKAIGVSEPELFPDMEDKAS